MARLAERMAVVVVPACAGAGQSYVIPDTIHGGVACKALGVKGTGQTIEKAEQASRSSPIVVVARLAGAAAAEEGAS